MADFIKSFVITIAFEGGYSNNPSDKGGETYKGISRVYFPNWGGWILLDGKEKVPDELVQQFYKANFWDTNLLDILSNQLMANKIFDCAVNMSNFRAGQFFQRALNILNLDSYKRQVFPSLTLDGVIGKKTISAYHTLTEERQLACYKIFQSLRCYRYILLCETDSDQKQFMLGWSNRI